MNFEHDLWQGLISRIEEISGPIWYHEGWIDEQYLSLILNEPSFKNKTLYIAVSNAHLIANMANFLSKIGNSKISLKQNKIIKWERENSKIISFILQPHLCQFPQKCFGFITQAFPFIKSDDVIKSIVKSLADSGMLFIFLWQYGMPLFLEKIASDLLSNGNAKLK
jgi:hypothetical protein